MDRAESNTKIPTDRIGLKIQQEKNNAERIRKMCTSIMRELPRNVPRTVPYLMFFMKGMMLI